MPDYSRPNIKKRPPEKVSPTQIIAVRLPNDLYQDILDIRVGEHAPSITDVVTAALRHYVPEQSKVRRVLFVGNRQSYEDWKRVHRAADSRWVTCVDQMRGYDLRRWAVEWGDVHGLRETDAIRQYVDFGIAPEREAVTA